MMRIAVLAFCLLLMGCPEPRYVYAPSSPASMALAECRAQVYSTGAIGGLDQAILRGAALDNCMRAKGFQKQ